MAPASASGTKARTWKKRLSSLAPAIEARIAEIDAEKADLVELLTGGGAGGGGGDLPKKAKRSSGMSEETKKKHAARMRKYWREKKAAKAAASGQDPVQETAPEQTVEEVTATA